MLAAKTAPFPSLLSPVTTWQQYSQRAEGEDTIFGFFFREASQRARGAEGPQGSPPLMNGWFGWFTEDYSRARLGDGFVWPETTIIE